MHLIAVSGKRRSGKTTLGSILQVEYGYTPISIAAPLKEMVRTHFGLTVEQTDGEFKEHPTQYRRQGAPAGFITKIDDSFWTPRRIMIETGRFYRSVDPDFWVKKLFDQIKTEPQAQMGTYVITDVRFKNEIEWMRRHGALTVRLERPEEFTGANIDDPSETELDDYEGWDIHVKARENTEMDDLHRIAGFINGCIIARD